MMNDKPTLEATGQYRIFTFDEDGNKVYKDWNKNAIVANSLLILTRLLGGQDWPINTIAAYDAVANLLFAADVRLVEFPANNQVKFTAVFEPDDFTGTVVQLQLVSSEGGAFSIAFPLDIPKGPTDRFGVEWLLTIGFCEPLIILDPGAWLLPSAWSGDSDQVWTDEGGQSWLLP